MPTKLKVVIGIWTYRLIMEISRPLLAQNFRPIVFIFSLILLIGIIKGNEFTRTISIPIECLSGAFGIFLTIGFFVGTYGVSSGGNQIATAVGYFVGALGSFFCMWCLAHPEVKQWFFNTQMDKISGLT